MAFTSLLEASLQSGQPLTTDIMQTIRTNLDDLDNRVEASVNTNITIFNQVLNKDEHPNGTLMWAFMTESEFQATMGDGWRLVDSSTDSFVVENTGATFNTPAGAQKFLYNRGNVSTDLEGITNVLGNTLGSRTAAPVSDSGGGHTHTVGNVHNENSNGNVGFQGGPATGALFSVTNAAQSNTHTHNWDNSSRPAAIVCNLFLKKQPNTYTKKLVYKLSNNITLETAQVTQFVAGTSGTLEVDVKYGTSLTSLTSVFSTKPSVAYTAGSYATSTNKVFSTTDIDTGYWLVLDITSVQNRDPECHILLEGSIRT